MTKIPGESLTQSNPLSSFAKYTRPRVHHFIVRSSVLELLAWLFLFHTVISLWNLVSLLGKRSLNVFEVYDTLPAIFFFLLFFFVLRRRAKRYRLASAKALMKARRSPIIYLRGVLQIRTSRCALGCGSNR
jgi:hypothetical protein